MKKFDRIEYNVVQQDYLINGESLLKLLQLHAGISPNQYIPAVESKPATRDRLSGKTEPDLQQDHVAIYLCGHCGDYDGNPIGVRIVQNENSVSWTEMGHFYDYDTDDGLLFPSMRTFTFDRLEYQKFLDSCNQNTSSL